MPFGLSIIFDLKRTYMIFSVGINWRMNAIILHFLKNIKLNLSFTGGGLPCGAIFAVGKYFLNCKIKYQL